MIPPFNESGYLPAGKRVINQLKEEIARYEAHQPTKS
jgi:hypothetical protein